MGLGSAPAIQNAVRANLPTNLPKNINEISNANRARITGPSDVLAVEAWGGREWQPATSSGGVPIEIGRLRARALVGAS
jgi:hypothetical protein